MLLRSWIDVFNVTCVDNKFDVKTTSGATVNEFVTKYRCTHKKIPEFYVSSDCKNDEVCAEVTTLLLRYFNNQIF